MVKVRHLVLPAKITGNPGLFSPACARGSALTFELVTYPNLFTWWRSDGGILRHSSRSLSVTINNGFVKQMGFLHPVPPEHNSIWCNQYELLSAHEPTTIVKRMSLRAVTMAHTRAYSAPESDKPGNSEPVDEWK